MATTDTLRNKISSQLSALNTLKSNTFVDDSQYKDDLSSVNGITTKTINDFTSKLKGKTDNKKDIFEELMNTVESFIGSTKSKVQGRTGNVLNSLGTIGTKETPMVKKKLLRYAKDAAQIALASSKEALVLETKKSFFGAAGICDDATTTGASSMSLSPKEFDFVNVLKIDPESISGKLMYENSVDLGVGTKFNRKLYENFDSGLAYPFTTQNNTNLFSMTWNSGNQQYDITMSDKPYVTFIEEYYNNIEYPSIQGVMATAMQMTLQGDGTESVSFNDGMKYLNRLTTKLCSLCGKSANDKPMVNNTPQQITEDEIDGENYFNFDDVEGIDLDDEDTKYRRVLKFRDCNNFEIPTNSNHIEDFSYLLGQKNLDENIDNTINKAATDAYEQSGGDITLDGFKLSLNTSYILKIPKALMGAVLSPKMIFPIALTYKRLTGTQLTVKDLMKKLYKLFMNVIKTIFWRFIKEFWGFVKKDLLNFIKEIALEILKNKLKKIKTIIQVLIDIIVKILDSGIQSCQDIFGAILKTINMALNRKVNISIPGMLLFMSDSLPGYSSDRAHMKVMEKLSSAGINAEPIYGTENKLPSVIKAILSGHSEEMDKNSFVKIGLKITTIPTNGTNAYITPLIEGAGKVF